MEKSNLKAGFEHENSPPILLIIVSLERPAYLQRLLTGVRKNGFSPNETFIVNLGDDLAFDSLNDTNIRILKGKGGLKKRIIVHFRA